jgi:hypothetical protein
LPKHFLLLLTTIHYFSLAFSDFFFATSARFVELPLLVSLDLLLEDFFEVLGRSLVEVGFEEVTTLSSAKAYPIPSSSEV